MKKQMIEEIVKWLEAASQTEVERIYFFIYHN